MGRVEQLANHEQPEELKRELDSLRKLLWETNVAIYLAQDGKILNPNPATLEMYGHSEEELTSNPFTKFIHPDDQALVRERHLMRQRGENPPSTYSFRIINAEGMIRHVELNVVPSSWEGSPATFCVQTDITERRRAEEALGQSLIYTSAIMANMVDPLIVIDEGGIIESFNPAAENVFGYGADEVIGQSVNMLMTESDRSNHDGHIANYLKLGHSKILGKGLREVIVRRKNGSEMPLEIAIGGIGTETGMKFVGSFRDISERKRDAEALKESEARFRDIAESSSDWFWETDADDRYTLVSGAIDADGGPNQDWYIGKTNSEIVDKYYERSDWQPYYEAVKARRPFRDIMLRLKDRNGWLQWVKSSGRPFFDTEGNFRGFRGTASDITEQKLVEQALRESESRYRALSDMTSEGVAIFENGIIVELNQAFADMFGYPVAELVGMSVVDLTAPESRQGAVNRLAQNESYEYETIILRKDGSRVHIENKSRPLVYKGRQMRVSQARDLTESRQAAAALRESEERLRQAQKIEAVGQLTGGIAHDFNNILAAITGNLDLVQDGDGISDETDRESIATALRAALRGAELTHRLLAFSRQQALDARETQINEILPQFHLLAERTIGVDITIETRPATGLWPTMIDAGQLENALLNLAINARDAMPDGGRLVIETANQVLAEDDTAVYEDLQPGDYVMIAVSDSGTGMPAAVRARAFEPFFTTKDVGAGSGLGLSMVFGFARQSGGQVLIDSENDEGTTVRIYLPRMVETASVESTEGEIEQDRPTGNETILVVEDEADVLAYLVRALNRLGYNVLQAMDGPEALDVMASSGAIDLLLTDVILPREMNGRDVANAFRKQFPAAAVLYSSGYTREVLDSRGQLDEDVALLSKPFRPRALARRVREVLDGRKRTL